MSDYENLLERIKDLETKIDNSEVRIMTALGFELVSCRDSYHDKPWIERRYIECQVCFQEGRGVMYSKADPADVKREFPSGA